MHDSTAPMLTL